MTKFMPPINEVKTKHCFIDSFNGIKMAFIKINNTPNKLHIEYIQ